MLLLFICAGCHGIGDSGVRGPKSVGDGGSRSDATLPTQLTVTASIDIGGEADWMGVGFGALWVPNVQTSELVRIDPQLRKVAAQIPIGNGRYRGVAIGTDAVFIPNTGDDTISKIDPTTNNVTATFPVRLNGDSEGAIGVTKDALWVVTDPGSFNRKAVLSRLDLVTGATLARIAIPSDSHGVIAEGAFVWVTSFGNNLVAQIDPQTNTVVRTITVDAGPRFVTSGGGSVWVLCQGTGRVARIDEVTGAVVAVIDAMAPGPGGDIAFGEGAVWVATFGVPVTMIDPATNTVLARFPQSGFGDAVRAGFGSLWVSGPRVFAVAVP
jgi:YVTN family beta-propeller protein